MTFRFAYWSLSLVCCLVMQASAQPPNYPTTGLSPHGQFEPNDGPDSQSANWSQPGNPDWDEPVGSALPPPTDLNAPFFDAHEDVAPQRWFVPLWEGTFELGMNGSDGNSDAFSLKAGASLKRETDSFLWELDITHARASANKVSTQNNALGSLRAERKLGDSPWSLFAKGMIEYDEFKAFDYRIAANGGLGYKFINLEHLKVGGRVGSGVSHEIGGPDDSYVPEALLGLDYEHKLTERQKLVAMIDYLPEWGEFKNFRLVTDIGWEILLDEEANLSLKIGVIDRYDSTPNGLKPNDLDYSLLLLWKL